MLNSLPKLYEQRKDSGGGIGASNISIKFLGSTYSTGSFPTLDPAVQMAWDPVGSTANAFGIGSHPDVTNYSIWPMDGGDDQVATDWAGTIDGPIADNLIIDYTDLSAAGVVAANQSYTTSFWMKRTNAPSGFATIWGIADSWPAFGGSTGSVGIRAENNDIDFGFRGSFGSVGQILGDVIQDEWIHLVVSIADNDMDAYLNGVRAAGHSNSGVDWEVKDIGVAMLFGSRAGNGIADHTEDLSTTSIWQGQVGDIRIYNTKLGDAEVLALYNAGRAEYAGVTAVA